LMVILSATMPCLPLTRTWRVRLPPNGFTTTAVRILCRTFFVAFLDDLDRQTPAGMQLHCIVDNLATHFTPIVEAFLEERPHIFLHTTPTHASWLNQVELFFAILQRRLLRYGEFDSVDDLADRVLAFINDYNRRAHPFRWTYDGRPLRVA